MVGWLPRAERYRFLPPEPVLRTALPWIVALMVALATLGVAAGMALAMGVGSLGMGVSSGLTVQIADGNPDRKAERAARIMTVLEASGAVTDPRQLSEERTNALLAPWLGTDDAADVLPVPVMIDANLVSGADVAAFRAAIADVDPEAIVDSHGEWFAPFSRLGWTMSGLALGAALLLLVAMAATVVLGVRAGLGRQREALGILHVLGAEDRIISGLFQYRLAVTTLVGAAGGFLMAMLVLAAISLLLADIGGGLLGAASLPVWGWLGLLIVPVLAVLLAMLTTRMTVERALGERI
ncbi:MAG: hypothetical protein V2J26_00550 [Pacificimonas sp.]|jgi:cell division transport system permease protein|nr:hypothetical protein [Pacificimonas sp.]